ncbi:MAG TPA: hypothetical protein VGJ36_07195 [Gemmatimonadales bacterium]
MASLASCPLLRYQGFWVEVVLELGDGSGVGAWLVVWRFRHHFRASMPTPASAALRRLVPLKIPRRARWPGFLNPNIVSLR